MQPLSVSQAQARLKEQDTIDNLTSIYCQLIEQQTEYRSHLQAAQELRSSLTALRDRIELARPALLRCGLAPVSDEIVVTTAAEAAHEDGHTADASTEVPPRISTDSLCAATLAIAESLPNDAIPSSAQPSPLKSDSGVDGSGSRDPRPLHSNQGAGSDATPGAAPESFHLLYAPTFASLIPEYIAELALEEVIAVSASHVDPETVVGRLHATRLQQCYTPLQVFVPFTTSTAPAHTSPRACIEDGLRAYAAQYDIAHVSRADLEAHVQANAIAIASALLSLLQPLLATLMTLAPSLRPIPTRDATAPPTHASLDDSAASAADAQYTSWSSYADASRCSDTISPRRQTLTFLATSHLNTTTSSTTANSTVAATPEKNITGSLARHTMTESPCHRNRRRETCEHTQIYRRPGSHHAHDDEGGASDHRIETSGLSSHGASHDALRVWRSGLFWCRALMRLLLGPVRQGLLICQAFDRAWTLHATPSVMPARKTDQSAHAAPWNTAEPPFSCIATAAREPACGFDAPRVRDLLDVVCPAMPDAVSGSTTCETLILSLTATCEPLRALFSPVTLGASHADAAGHESASSSVKDDQSVLTAVALPDAWELVQLRAAIADLERCLDL